MKLDKLEQMYQDKCMDLIKLRMRCSQHRQAVEYALEYLKEMGDLPNEAYNITNLSEKAAWERIKAKREFQNS